MKPVEFRGKALDDLLRFPQSARRAAGYQIDRDERYRVGARSLQRTDEGEIVSKQRFQSVWDAIEDTPQQAASMRARSELVIQLTEVIKKRGMTQAEAAKLFGVTQPRVSDLTRGKVELFSLDALVDMAAVAGLAPQIKIKQAA